MPDRSTAARKILVLGQTPPPFHGQALMIEKLVTADFARLRLYHVRMGFSGSVQAVGKARIGKVLHLLQVATRALRIRFTHGVSVLYFSPAGPRLVPVLRDVMLLSLLRPFFPRVVYHFHAAGVSQYLEAAPSWLRSLGRAAYGRPAGAIQTSALNPADAAFFRAHHAAVIPNGVTDEAVPYFAMERTPEPAVRILFVGMLAESKGVLVLLEAARELARHRQDFTVWFMGQFATAAFEQSARHFCRVHGMDALVSFLGERTGAAKWDCFRRADILCFPSFYESESFGLVAVEAMMFGLPVVATRWRGIPDVVADGETGYLVPIRDPSALAHTLELLICNPDLRRTLGCNGRQKYLAQYTMERHLERMENFLLTVASDV